MTPPRRFVVGIATLTTVATLLSTYSFGALSITPGNTFSVASQSGLPAVGTHFHSNHAGALGNPPDKAEVGSLQNQAFSMEECRGFSEFSLAGLASGTASVTFVVSQTGGLFSGQNSFPFTGNIGLLAYAGNNADDIADYSATPIAPIGTFSTAGLSIGTSLTFDVTSLYTAQLVAGSLSLGIRLQTTPLTVTGGGAFTFDSFTLNVESESEVPEPASLVLLLGGACPLLLRRGLRNRFA